MNCCNRTISLEGTSLTKEENLISAYIAMEKMEAVNTTKVFRRKNSTHGNPLWLLGVDAPTGQKSFFKMSKNSETKL
jgi:hypothetical protein